MKLTVTLLVFLLLELITVKAFPKTQCIGKDVDIMFVLDSSSSIWPNDYDRLLKFLHEFVNTFEVGSNKMLMGAITFSKKAHLEFSIGQYINKEELQKAIANIPHRRGWTNTGAALKLANEQFHSLNKTKASLVTIVITDGNSRSRKKTVAEARKLHKLGIKVYAVGIGNKFNKFHIKELEAISSDPENGVYRVLSYKALESIGKNFYIKSCEVEEPKALKSTAAVPTQTTKSPVLTVNDTTTTVSPNTTAAVPDTTSPIPDTTATTPNSTIETTTQRVRNETKSKDKPAKGRPELLSKDEANVILFGYDMISMGYHHSLKISMFLKKLLPYMGYQFFGVTNYAYCPPSFNVPLTPLTNSTGELFHLNNLPTLVDVVRKMRNLIYTHVIHQAHYGTPTAVLFVDSDVTNITDSLLEETRKLKELGTRLFLVNIGFGEFPSPRDFYFLSSQPYNYYTYNIQSYKRLVYLAKNSPYDFKYMINYDFPKESSKLFSKRPELS